MCVIFDLFIEDGKKRKRRRKAISNETTVDSSEGVRGEEKTMERIKHKYLDGKIKIWMQK